MLNWLARYAPTAAQVIDDAGAARGSILDVGCGPHGLACACPDVPFVGLDVEYPVPVAASMTAIRAQPGRLPFADASFDYVVCLDTLEHVPRPDRAGFVAELARVAAGRVLLACPSTDGAYLDVLARQRFEGAGVAVPEWLSEHDEHGLPTPAEIEAQVRAVTGFEARPWPMVNGLLTAAVTFADLFELGGHAARTAAEDRDAWLRVLGGATFGSSFRAAWTLERIAAPAARVDRADLDGSLPAALECPACASGFTADGARLVCDGCGVVVARDAMGAWALPAPAAAAPAPVAPAPLATPVAPAPLPAPTLRLDPSPAAGQVDPAPADGHALRLTPTWAAVDTWLPALAAYVRGAAPEAGHQLLLDVGGDDLPTEVAGGLVGIACELLVTSGDFADVVVLGVGEPAPEATAVTSAADVRRVLGLPEPAVPVDPAAAVALARDGKQLADELQAVVDRQRYLAGDDPFAAPSPRVTVCVPAGGRGRDALARTLRSVLAGTWRAVEVQLVTDGDDPEATAAAAVVADPRVTVLDGVDAALDAATGTWIATVGGADELTATHVEDLVRAAQQHQRDVVHAQALVLDPDGPPRVTGGAGDVAGGTTLHAARLKHVRADPHAWLLADPAERAPVARMVAAGAALGFLPAVVAVRSGPPSVPAPTPEPGVLAASVRWYLDVSPAWATTGA